MPFNDYSLVASVSSAAKRASLERAAPCTGEPRGTPADASLGSTRSLSIQRGRSPEPGSACSLEAPVKHPVCPLCKRILRSLLYE